MDKSTNKRNREKRRKCLVNCVIGMGDFTISKSTSDPELISADTLFIRRANVTFFSSLGSCSWHFVADDNSENVVSRELTSGSSPDICNRLSVIKIRSSRLI